jgi:FdrA protein
MMATTLEDLLQGKPVFINVGVREFGDTLRKTGFDVVHVDWSPPAGGDARMAAILDELL